MPKANRITQRTNNKIHKPIRWERDLKEHHFWTGNENIVETFPALIPRYRRDVCLRQSLLQLMSNIAYNIDYNRQVNFEGPDKMSNELELFLAYDATKACKLINDMTPDWHFNQSLRLDKRPIDYRQDYATINTAILITFFDRASIAWPYLPFIKTPDNASLLYRMILDKLFPYKNMLSCSEIEPNPYSFAVIEMAVNRKLWWMMCYAVCDLINGGNIPQSALWGYPFTATNDEDLMHLEFHPTAFSRGCLLLQNYANENFAFALRLQGREQWLKPECFHTICASWETEIAKDILKPLN